MSKIAFLGAGLIGAAMARAALKRGQAVCIYNRTISKAQALEADGAQVASTPAQAVVGASRVHIALSSDHAVDAVLDQCLDQLTSATVVIDHSTTSIQGARQRALRLADAGVAYLHAPVFMSPAACLNAQGIMLVCGPSAHYEQVAHELALMTGEVVYLGESPELAATYKLFGNAMIISMTAGLSDVFAMARAQGVEPTQALSLFEKFNPSNIFSQRGKRMAQGDFDASFELTMARKDIGLMLEAASNQPLSVLPAIAQRMDALIDQGHGEQDLGVLAIDPGQD